MRYLAYVAVTDPGAGRAGRPLDTEFWFDSEAPVDSGRVVTDCVAAYRRRHGQALTVRVERVLTESEAID